MGNHPPWTSAKTMPVAPPPSTLTLQVEPGATFTQIASTLVGNAGVEPDVQSVVLKLAGGAANCVPAALTAIGNWSEAMTVDTDAEDKADPRGAEMVTLPPDPPLLPPPAWFAERDTLMGPELNAVAVTRTRTPNAAVVHAPLTPEPHAEVLPTTVGDPSETHVLPLSLLICTTSVAAQEPVSDMTNWLYVGDQGI